MFTRQKRLLDDALLHSDFLLSAPAVPKRHCISPVPGVPRGGANYSQNSNAGPPRTAVTAVRSNEKTGRS